MSDGGWRAADPVERGLVAAREAGDLPAFLLTVARADLLLLMPDDPTAAWAVSSIEGRSCLVAFTSVHAMTAVLGKPQAHRLVRVAELAATWPAPDLHLAVDPGLPVEAFLDADTVQDLAILSAQPATQRETRLLQALDGDDVEAYVAVLMEGDVLLPLPDDLLPLPDDGAQSVHLTDPGFAWYRLPAEALAQAVGAGPEGGAGPEALAQAVGDGPGGAGPKGPGPILAFTSPERLRDLIGDQLYVEVPFAAVVHAWPDASDLLVDPGLAHGGALAGATLQHLRSYVRARLDDVASG